MKVIMLIITTLVIGFVQVETAEWGYDGPKGVSNWTLLYPTCGGNQQSPINIATAEYDDDLEEFTRKGYKNTSHLQLMISNNGHSVSIAIPTAVSKSLTVAREGLANPYYAFQFHFHWGSDNTKGSEHTIGGQAFPMEMHFIHINSKYANVSQALKNEDGLLVFGTMFQVSSSDSPVITAIKPKLGDIIEPDNPNSRSNYVNGLNLEDLFPSDDDEYFTYRGSLTTPGCYQVVSWHLHRKVLRVTQETLNEFRKLKAHKGVNTNGLISNNFRPVQPLHNRKVKSSFKADDNDDDNTSAAILITSHMTDVVMATAMSLFLASIL